MIESLGDLFHYTPMLRKTEFDAEVPDDLVIMRYLTDWKFQRLVKGSVLYFSREDNLRLMDANEGRDADANVALDSKHPGNDGIDSEIQRKLRRQVREESWIPQTFVSCFYMGDEEDLDMWHEYVGEDNGVAIFTTVRRLRELCNGRNAAKEAIIAPITYIDRLTDLMAEHGNYYTMLYKDKSFRHERELRFMVRYGIGAVGGTYKFWGDRWPNAERRPIKLNSFVDKVVVAPQSRKVYKNLVENLLQSHGFGAIPVHESTFPFEDRP